MSAGCGASGSGSRSVVNRRRSGRPRPADRLQPGGQWQRAVGRLRLVERASTSGEPTRSSAAGGRNGSRRSRQTAIAGSSSRFVRARIARVASSSGQASTTRPIRTGSSARDRARGRSAPSPPGPARIVFANRSRLCSTRRTARPTTGRRAAVVHDEVDPAQARQRRGERQDPAHVGEPPAVDRLVVVADEEDAVRRRREEQRQPELRPVEVLRLVDEQVRRTARASARATPASPRAAPARGPRGRRSRAPPSRRRAARTRRTSARPGPPPGRRRPRRRSTPQVQLEARDRECRAGRQPAGPASGATWRRTPSGRRAAPRTAPASRRISRPSAWNVRTRTAPAATPSGSSAAASRSPSSSAARRVERDRGDRIRARRAAVDQPRDAGDERRRLAASPPARRTGRARAAPSRRHAGPARDAPAVRRPPGGRSMHDRMVDARRLSAAHRRLRGATHQLRCERCAHARDLPACARPSSARSLTWRYRWSTASGAVRRQGGPTARALAHVAVCPSTGDGGVIVTRLRAPPARSVGPGGHRCCSARPPAAIAAAQPGKAARQRSARPSSSPSDGLRQDLVAKYAAQGLHADDGRLPEERDVAPATTAC